MDWVSEIKSASDRLNGYTVVTPVAKLKGFGLDHSIEVKFEQMQHTGNFKVRGAFNTMLSGEAPAARYVAASGGNHGAAVAYAAKTLGRKAHIFVPEVAGPSKINLIKGIGAGLTVVPGAYSDAAEAAQAYEAETGAVQIHPYDAEKTVVGQGTVYQEWEDQGLEADTILIAVGGGGLISGAMAWFQKRRKVVAVEPINAPSLNASLAAGSVTDVEVSGVAMNALGARRIGQICLGLATAQNLTSLTIPDSAITEAQHALWRAHRQLVEPAGATALAALMSGAYKPEKDERVAVLICGANPEPDPFG